MHRTLFSLLWLVGCKPVTAAFEHAPVFGGDQRAVDAVRSAARGVQPDPEELTAAGFFSAIAGPAFPCEQAVCVDPHAAWSPEGTLFVGVSVVGGAPRPAGGAAEAGRAPADVAIVLDLSGSMAGADRGRAPGAMGGSGVAAGLPTTARAGSSSEIPGEAGVDDAPGAVDISGGADQGDAAASDESSDTGDASDVAQAVPVDCAPPPASALASDDDTTEDTTPTAGAPSSPSEVPPPPALEPMASVLELVTSHLGPDDRLTVVGFRSQAAPLIDLAVVDGTTTARVWELTRALADLPRVEAELPRLRELTDLDPCDAGVDATWRALIACVEAEVVDGEPHPCGEGWPIDEADLEPSLDALDTWTAWLESENGALATGLPALMCDAGTSLAAGAAAGVAALPDGSNTRSSRLFFASDLVDPEGADLVTATLAEAATRYVGTTVLAMTPARDRDLAGELGSLPGALTVDLGASPDALIPLDTSFDAYLSPRAWGLQLAVAKDADWELVAVHGGTDLTGAGANAVFAAPGTGLLALELRPRVEHPADPLLITTAYGVDQTWRKRLVADVPDGVRAFAGWRFDELDEGELAFVVATWRALSAWATDGDTAPIELLDATLRSVTPVGGAQQLSVSTLLHAILADAPVSEAPPAM